MKRPKLRYRMCEVETDYGIMYLVEIRRFFIWFELFCVCSIENAEKEIAKHARPRQIKYWVYNQAGEKF